jgi:hypothetical protein
MNKDALYTARWSLNQGEPLAKGSPPALAAIEAITAAIEDRVVGPRSPQTDGPTGHRGDVGPAGPPGPVNVAMSVSESKPAKPNLDIAPLFPLDGPFPMIGAGLSRADFSRYLSDVVAEKLADKNKSNWPLTPRGVCIHHTAAPSLAQRPKGWQREHMVNLRAHYLGLGWNKGPHLFIDEDEIFLFTPLWHRGTHAVAFNSGHWGIEMLGDYDHEDPTTGRGKAVIETAAYAAAALLEMIGVDENFATVRFHRDDPSTSKSCPGKRIEKPAFLRLVTIASDRLALS